MGKRREREAVAAQRKSGKKKKMAFLQDVLGLSEAAAAKSANATRPRTREAKAPRALLESKGRVSGKAKAAGRSDTGAGAVGGGGDEMVVVGATLQEVGTVNPRAAGLYSSKAKILLVGEASFLFASALCTAFVSAKNLVASSLDSRKEVLKKYGSEAHLALTNVDSSGAQVLHGIDATKEEDVARCLGDLDAFDVVVFNFPHVGGSTAEHVEANQAVLTGFFQAATRVLASPGGQIHVALRETPFYTSWNIRRLAEDCGLRFIAKHEFDAQAYPGYHAVRTTPAFRDAPETKNAFTFVFGRNSGTSSAPLATSSK